jgi:hypothetical protein
MNFDFKAKLIEQANKPKSLINIENIAVKFISTLDSQFGVLAFLYKKLKYVNDLYVLSITNYTNQIDIIKSGHNSAVNYLKELISNHYVTCKIFVDRLEQIFILTNEIEKIKNKYLEMSTISGNKGNDIKYQIVTDPNFQTITFELAMKMQEYVNNFFSYSKSVSSVVQYIGNTLKIQDKLIKDYQNNPQELTTQSSNDRYLEHLKGERKILDKIFEEFKSKTSKVEYTYNQVRSLLHHYRKEHNILPIELIGAENNKDFGTYKHLIDVYKTLDNAITNQIGMLKRELKEITQKENINYDPEIYIDTDPKIIKLRSKKDKIKKKIQYASENVDTDISELRNCIETSGKDIEYCMKKLKNVKKYDAGTKVNTGVGTKVNTGAIISQNIAPGGGVNYLKMKDSLIDSNRKMRIYLQSMYKIKRRMADEAEFNEGVKRHSEYQKLNLDNKMLQKATELVDDKIDKEMKENLKQTGKIAFELGDLRGGSGMEGALSQMSTSSGEIFGGGNKPYYGGQSGKIVLYLDKLHKLSRKQLIYKMLREKYADSYQNLYNQHYDNIKKKLEEGVSKSSDVLLKEAFVQDIEIYVDQQFNSCDSMSIQQLPSIGSEQLYITGGCGCSNGGCGCSIGTGGSPNSEKILPGNTDLIIAKRLTNQIPNSFLQDLKGKMFAIFGPTSQQYKYVTSIINRVATNRKNAIYYKYQNNYKQMELEFLKIDTCATNIKEKILQNITMYPTYGAICRIRASNFNNILLKVLNNSIDVIEKQVSITYNQAKGFKEIIKKCIKIIGKKINHIMKECQFIKSDEVNIFTGKVNKILDKITSLTNIQEKLRNDIADEYEIINRSIFNFKSAIKNADFVYNKKYITIKNKDSSFNIRKQILFELDAKLQRTPDGAKNARVSEEVMRKLAIINEQKDAQRSYNDIFTKPLESQNENVEKYINDIKTTISDKVKKLSANVVSYKKVMDDVILYCKEIIGIELDVNLTRASKEEKEKIQTPEDLFKYVDRHTDKNLTYRIQEFNIQNNVISMYQHKKDQIEYNIEKNSNLLERSKLSKDNKLSEDKEESENIINIYSVNLLRKNIDKLFKPGDSKLTTCLMRLHKLYNILRNNKIDKMFMVSNEISKMNNSYMIFNNAVYNILDGYKSLMDVHTKGYLSLVHGLLKIKLSIEVCFDFYAATQQLQQSQQSQRELYLSSIDSVYNSLTKLYDTYYELLEKSFGEYYKSKNDIVNICININNKINLDMIIQNVIKIMDTYGIPKVENLESIIAGFVAYDIYESL